MSLRSQLLVVSLCLLSLPWAGCQYLREMESALREGQGIAATATARAVAAALRERNDLLYPAPQRQIEGNAAVHWYLLAASQPLISDGYADDWRVQPALTPLPDTPNGVTVHAATRGERLFLYLDIEDTTLRYRTPGSGARVAGDRAELRCIDSRGIASDYLVATEAPGLVRARRRDGSADQLSDRIRGAWRERGSGYTLELQAPLTPLCQRLAIAVIDADSSGERRRFDIRSNHDGKVPWLVYRHAALDSWLAAFEEPGRTVSVRDHLGWEVGQHTSTASAATQDDEEVFWLLRALYRAVLRDTEEREGQTSATDASMTDWNAAPFDDGSRILVRASSGIYQAKGLLGNVEVTETTERYLALTDRASTRVFGISALLLAGAFSVLLAYATVLSWRIRRLRDAARGIATQCLDAKDFPRSAASDELGELSRSYADLLRQISEYNQYLRGLARTLSHELRTPIAVVSSSLENLSRDPLANSERNQYLQRARDGLSRLTRIVTAMSEASRIEESLLGASTEPLDLTPLIRALREAYATTFATHDFALNADEVPLTVDGNGELLAQALDKLVDNAVSFTAAGTTITIDLEEVAGEARIAISNHGPLLPAALRERLFEPMVSLRDGRGDDDTHLGIGLHIARAIAEAHGGHLQAADLPDGSGVVFTVCIPRRARTQSE